MQPPALGSTETEVELETKPDPIVEKVTTEKIDVVPSTSTEKPVEKPAEDPSLNEVFEDEKKVSGGIDKGLVADEPAATISANHYA